jgi:hypothetical protein
MLLQPFNDTTTMSLKRPINGTEDYNFAVVMSQNAQKAIQQQSQKRNATK